MERIRSGASWFFTGVRGFLPLLPFFIWRAVQEIYGSTVAYWKNSQAIVDRLADEYMDKVPPQLTTDYDPFPFWVCYCIASFLYLLGWLVMSWLTVEAFLLLTSLMF